MAVHKTSAELLLNLIGICLTSGEGGQTPCKAERVMCRDQPVIAEML